MMIAEICNCCFSFVLGLQVSLFVLTVHLTAYFQEKVHCPVLQYLGLTLVKLLANLEALFLFFSKQ